MSGMLALSAACADRPAPRRRARSSGGLGVVALGMLLLAGCGRNAGTVAVSGTVTSAGTAVADADVTFVPDSGSGPAAPTRSDETGAFAARMAPGRYRVTIFKPLLGGPDMHRSVLPERFMHPPETPLVAEVPARGPLRLRISLDDPPTCAPAAD